MNKTVPIEQIISITQPRLVCDFADLHEFVEYLAGGPVWTHQLLRVVPLCQTYLAEQFPDLAAIETPAWEDEPGWESAGPGARADIVRAWVRSVAAEHGETREVEPLPAGAIEERNNPIEELVEIRQGTS